MEIISVGAILYSDAGPCGEACMGCITDCSNCLHCYDFIPCTDCFCPINA